MQEKKKNITFARCEVPFIAKASRTSLAS